MKKIFLLSLPLIVLASACTSDQGNFTVISNKAVDLKHLNLNTVQKTKDVKGDREAFIVFIIPFGDLNPDLPGALNDCFEKGHGDMMTDAHCYATSFWIPYIYGRFGYHVEGDVVKSH